MHSMDIIGVTGCPSKRFLGLHLLHLLHLPLGGIPLRESLFIPISLTTGCNLLIWPLLWDLELTQHVLSLVLFCQPL